MKNQAALATHGEPLKIVRKMNMPVLEMAKMDCMMIAMTPHNRVAGMTAAKLACCHRNFDSTASCDDNISPVILFQNETNAGSRSGSIDPLN